MTYVGYSEKLGKLLLRALCSRALRFAVTPYSLGHAHSTSPLDPAYVFADPFLEASNQGSQLPLLNRHLGNRVEKPLGRLYCCPVPLGGQQVNAAPHLEKRETTPGVRVRIYAI